MAAYAQVEAGIATRVRLPNSARRLDTGQWIMGLATASLADQKATGYYPYEPADPPAVNASQIADHTGPAYSAGPDSVTDTWTVRNKTAPELAMDAAEANRLTIRTQAEAAIATNTTALALPDPTPGNTTYLAIGAPNNAQVVAQVRALTLQNNALVAQVRELTKQNNKLARLTLGLYAGTD